MRRLEIRMVYHMVSKYKGTYWLLPTGSSFLWTTAVELVDDMEIIKFRLERRRLVNFRARRQPILQVIESQAAKMTVRVKQRTRWQPETASVVAELMRGHCRGTPPQPSLDECRLGEVY
jgi:hypothetical protein